MAHDAEYDCAQGEQQHRLLGEGQPPGAGLSGGAFRWVCGAVPHPAEPLPASRRGVGPDVPPETPERTGSRVPRQRDGGPRDGGPPEETDPVDVPDSRSGCRTERPGWAGAHRHGAVRPRSRTHRRERPPHRWC
jgi:hypothetical protein